MNELGTIPRSLWVHYALYQLVCQELFFESVEFFCQGEWIRLVAYPILDELIIP